MRFSYVVHSSADSAADHRELTEYGDMADGVFRRSDGACCDNCKATVGGRCNGGCNKEDAMIDDANRSGIESSARL
jgi:hypothetical protein